jgi:ribose transport system permease protein
MYKTSRGKRIIQSKVFQMLSFTAVVLLVTFIVRPGSFTLGNAQQILSTLSWSGVFLCGVAILLLVGGIDFAGSAHATCAMLLFAQILLWSPNLPWPVAMIVALIAGAVAGGVNAFFVNGLNLMPFIVTIGMSSIWGGIALWVTHGTQIQIRNMAFNNLSTLYIPGTPIPVLFLFMALLVVFYTAFIKKTSFGRSILMAGGNPAASRLAGLNPKRIRTILYINNGVLSALGALMWASQQKMASPTGLTALAPQMTALIATLLGGVSFIGGAGSLGGAFCGMVLINVLAYALQTMGLPLWLITLVNGMLLVVALTIDGINMQRRFKKLGVKMAGGGAVMPGMSK